MEHDRTITDKDNLIRWFKKGLAFMVIMVILNFVFSIVFGVGLFGVAELLEASGTENVSIIFGTLLVTLIVMLIVGIMLGGYVLEWVSDNIGEKKKAGRLLPGAIRRR
jgi:hypothetical protein